VVIEIEAAKPGMKLLEDVLLPNGAILINAPQVLSQATLDVLKKRGIKKIQIYSEQSLQELAAKEIQEKEKIAAALAEAAAVVEKDASPTPPTLRVVIKEDLLSAKLCIEPTDRPNQVLVREDILSTLADQGISFGINENAINAAIEKWKKYKRYYEVEDIAKGTLPQPGKEGAYEFRVKYLGAVNEIDHVRKAKHFSDIPRESPLQRVDPGTMIAKRSEDTPPLPGRNVKGEAVTTTDIIKTEMSGDSSVKFSDDKSQIVAQTSGFAFFLEGHLTGIIPFAFDGAVEISVSPDKMKAELIVFPPGPGGKVPTKDDIRALLANQKILFGLVSDELDKLYADLGRGSFPAGPVVIAQGLPPKPGENGSVKFLFSTESSLKPKVNQDGTVDYKNIDIVTSVVKGQKLAELVAPAKGAPGKNIFGADLPCINGTPAKLPLGANTAASAGEPSVLVAATDGNVKFNGTNVEISEGFVIKGNVDFTTGNVKYAKSVVVAGDIKSGFKVECGGDLQVSGTIEDSDIQVNGNVLCKLGFIGQGKGVISAKGDINILFMKNQTAKSRQNIVIAKEALNATLLARKSVEVRGNPLSLAGGRVMARDSVTAFTIGNMSGIKTLIEVGTDFTLIEELEKTDIQLNDLAENRKKILVTYQRYEKIKDIKKTLNPKEEFLYAKLKTTLSKYDQQIKTLEDRKNIVTEKMNNFKTCFIKIDHAAMPGTMFKIGARHFLVKEEVIGPKTVRLINEEIRVI
jgi:uncharacterized protein (DUF342 family)